MGDDLRLILVDRSPLLTHEWARAFEGKPNVQILAGHFEDLPEFDCIVSPGNSFGLMDGGIDGAIVAYFGEGLMRRVQQRIVDEYLGEQPVGTCILVPTDDRRHPYLAHAPTMRVPMEISRTDYAYLAMWAVLLAVHRHYAACEQSICSLACPGLGAGTGRMPAREVARQMALAYAHYLDPPSRLDWDVATRRQAAIGRGGDCLVGLRPA